MKKYNSNKNSNSGLCLVHGLNIEAISEVAPIIDLTKENVYSRVKKSPSHFADQRQNRGSQPHNFTTRNARELKYLSELPSLISIIS